MRTLRAVLAFPIWLLSLLIGVIGVIGVGVHRMQQFLGWIGKLWSEHVYIVVVWMHRWIQGVPTWQIKDLTMINIQPRTKAQIAYADTLPELQRYQCQCGNPKCRAKGRILFGPKTPEPMPASMEIDNLPPAIQAMARNMERLMKMQPDEVARLLDAHDAIKAATDTAPTPAP